MIPAPPMTIATNGDPEDEDSDDEFQNQLDGHGGTLTSRGKRQPASTFKKAQTKILQKWFLENIEHPYLKKDDKAMLADQTGLTKKQITGWFTNNRKRKY